MNFRQNLGFTSMFTLALGLAACDLGEKQIGDDEGTTGDGDGDSGDGDGDDGQNDPSDSGDGDGDGDGIGPCGEESVTSMPSNPEDYFASPMDAFDGKSVNDILAVVEDDYAGTFTWGAAEGVVWLPDHAGMETALTVTATFAGGDAILTEVPLAGQWVEDELLAQLCANTLEFDVTLDFATEDGLFDESLIVTVTAVSHTDPEGGSNEPSIYYHLDLAAQQGSLDLGDFTVTDGTLTDLIVIGSFGEAGFHGSLNAEVETMEWVGFGSIAGFDAPRVP